MSYPFIGIVLSCLCVSALGYTKDPEMLKSSMPAYAITSTVHLLNSTRCRTEMEEFRASVDHGVLWGLRMLDASGEPSAGFTSGNNYWAGNRKRCNYLSQHRSMQLSEKNVKNNSIYRNPADEYPPFLLNFFGAHVRHNATIQYHIEVPKEDVIVLGLCLPASCSEHEVATMLKKVFDERMLQIGHLYSMDLQLIRLSNMIDDHSWLLNGKIISIFCILAALVCLVIVGTLYDGLVHQQRLQKKKEFLTYENNNTAELKGEMEEKREHDQEAVTPQELKPHSRIGQILLSFSLYSNMQQIFKIDNSSKNLTSLHGLKFFGMLWIMIVHTIFYTLNILDNKEDGYIMSRDIENQILSNGTLSVDTYLFISGFLLAYMFLKAQVKEKKVVPFQRNVINFCSAVFRRYLRITPAYIVTILLTIVNFSWYEHFTLWYFSEPIHELCSKYWWRNMLYINNLFGWSDLCLSWSWYLSNDMQFYIYGFFVLMLSTNYYYVSLSINVAILLVSTFLHAYVTYTLGYIPTLDMQFETLTYMYMRPWMRIQPYIVGMGTALLLTKWNCKLRLSKKAIAAGWCLSILCNCSILFGVADRDISLGLSVLYESFSRLGWSLGIAWLVIMCTTNNGGIVNKFLSLPYWIPFSRVSLCTYLLNPFLILSIGMYSNTPLNVDLLITGSICLGVCVATFVCAFLLSAMTEVPVILFVRVISSFNRRIK